jgi:hypothetical protein
MHRRCSCCDAADGAARRQQSRRLGGANNPDSSRRRAPDRARCWFAAAATIGKRETGIRLDNVSVLAEAFTAALGETFGRVVFAMGLSGGALVATINICLTAAWAIGEVTGVRHSLEHPPAVAPGFIWHLQLTLRLATWSLLRGSIWSVCRSALASPMPCCSPSLWVLFTVWPAPRCLSSWLKVAMG